MFFGLCSFKNEKIKATIKLFVELALLSPGLFLGSSTHALPKKVMRDSLY